MRDSSLYPLEGQVTSRRVRDVADFQARWAEFRPHALHALKGPALAPEDADVVGWMIEVMDRIAPRDIDDRKP